MSEAPARFAAPDGRRIAYAVEGSGPAVLCLPGLTRSRRDFADLAAHLADRHRVIRMDYRGRGASEHAEDPLSEYTPAVEGADALALLDHLEIGRAAIVGTSRGGLIGMGLAVQAAERVSCLVLNDIGPEIERAGLDAILSWLGQPPAASFAEAAALLAERMRAAFPDLAEAEWEAEARRLFRDEGGRPALDYDPRLRDAVEAAMAAPVPDLWPFFEAIPHPVLAIRGENSDILSAATLEAMRAAKPDMEAVTVPRRGHVPFLDEPPAREAIDAFLARHAD